MLALTSNGLRFAIEPSIERPTTNHASASRRGGALPEKPAGEFLVGESSTAAPLSSLVVRATVRDDTTLYRRWGDYFAWTNVTGLLLFSFLEHADDEGTARVGEPRRSLAP
jgi:hypothetical protein